MGSFLLLLAACALGCGGNGGGHSSSGDASNGLHLSSSADFNGTIANLGGTLKSSTAGDSTGVQVESGGRELLVNFPTARVTEGAELKIGETGVAAAYGETSGGSTKNWKATAGSIFVVAVTGKKVTVTLTGVAFAKDDGAVGNTAVGTFTLDGDLKDITLPNPPIDGGGGDDGGNDGGGSDGGGNGAGGDLAFSQAAGTNAITSAFGSGSQVAYNPSEVVTSVSLFTTDATDRVLGFTAIGALPVGQPITLGGEGNQIVLSYAQNTGGATQTWFATSGTATVTAKTATTISVTIANAKFEALQGEGNNATGTFMLNGVLAKG